MTKIFEIIHNYIHPNKWDPINKFLIENNLKWYAQSTDLETGVQYSNYFIPLGVSLIKIKSYPWPRDVISVNVKTFETSYLYQWNYYVPPEFNRGLESGYCVYTQKQVENFQKSNWNLSFEFSEISGFKFNPNDVKFKNICNSFDFYKNGLAVEICKLDDIINRFRIENEVNKEE